MDFEILDLRKIGGDEGFLVPIEENGDIPFAIKRVYYIYGTPSDVVRGRHAHKNQHQLLFCPIGQCDFILDDGREKTTLRLDSPDRGLYIKGVLWREFTNFSADCVVMVLSSECYDENDYIRNYDDFLQYTAHLSHNPQPQGNRP